MTRAFFDTNVVVYAVQPTPDLRKDAAQRLLDRHLDDGTLVVSSQVLQETYSVLTTKKGVTGPAALALVTALAEEEVVPSQASFVLRAVALAQRHQLSIWDALVVQAALDSSCDVLYTEDLQSGMRFGDLEVVNPFSLSAHEAAPGPALTAPAAPAAKAQAPRGAASAARAASPTAAPPASRPAPRRPRK